MTAVIPAYNEAERIGAVLEAVATYPGFAEVIVVDDGSADGTAAVAERFGVRVLRQTPNRGKAQAMERGVQAATGDIIFFCDADMRGFTHAMFDEVIEPVRNGEVDMSVAVHNRRLYWLSFLLIFIPVLGGQRALRKSLWERLPRFYKQGFRIETGLNFFARYYGNDYRLKVFTTLKHSVKESKHGIWRGLWARGKMISDIVVAQLALGAFHSPRIVRYRRKLAWETVGNLLGVALGCTLLFAAYWGPRQFVLDIFAEELQEDPSTPIIDTWLRLAGVVSIDVIIVLGVVLLALNAIILLLNLPAVVGLYQSVFAARKAAIRQ